MTQLSIKNLKELIKDDVIEKYCIIENEKQKLIDEIESSNSIYQLMSKVAKTCHYTKVQSNFIKEMLKNGLNADLFKNEDRYKDCSHSTECQISFSNENFIVSFSIMGDMIITIESKRKIELPEEHISRIPDKVLQVLSLWNAHKERKVGYSELLNEYAKLSGRENNLLFKLEVLFANRLRREVLYAKKVLEIEEKIIEFHNKAFSEYEVELMKLSSIMNDLEYDLKNFTSNGWTIEYKNIDGNLSSLQDYSLVTELHNIPIVSNECTLRPIS